MKRFNSNTRKEELARLNQCNNTLRNYFFVLVGLAVAALVAALLKFMIPSMLFLVALAVFRLTIHKKARNEYQQAITDAALTCSVGTRLDEFELSSKGGIGITREDILAAELVPVREGSDTYINFFQGIAGPSKGTEVSLNDTVPVSERQTERRCDHLRRLDALRPVKRLRFQPPSPLGRPSCGRPA